MKARAFLKTLTLLFFFSLIALFVLFRSGWFDGRAIRQAQTSPNGGAIPGRTKDTAAGRPDSTKPLRLSSSKVLILTEPDRKAADTVRKAVRPDSLSPNQLLRLYTSKSGVILDTSHIRKFDTIFRQAEAIKKKKQ